MKKKELVPYVAPCVQFYNVEIESVLCGSGVSDSSADDPEDFTYGGTL